tara:strand:+ start:2207 stop:4105 length:1899 start_codon:yes stop_codon:yes gene_type:complete
MCGFVTVFDSNNSYPNDNDKIILNEMLSSLNHRGPDSEGVYFSKKGASFGHKRLSIIDIEHGIQPMLSDDSRFILVFNGEIYNYLELRSYLIQKGVTFSSFSDTEVLLKLLIHDGPDKALARLNGMFAFIFFDQKESKWIAARDHFGIKPIYFIELNNKIIFSSEIKSLLLHPKVNAKRSQDALLQYLSFQLCLGNNTLFEGIKKIMPGQYIVGSKNKIIKIKQFWDMNFEIKNESEDYFVETLSELLSDAIRLQIRSDVPIGGYLSGGLDSSVVSSLAARKVDTEFSTFHGRFPNKGFDESKYAKMVSNNINSKYHDIVPSELDFVDNISDIIYYLDEPVAGPGVFPQFFVSKLARENVKVVLGGQGGDEIFGGYTRYLIGYFEQVLKGSIFEDNSENKHIISLEKIIPNLPTLKNYVPLLSHFWKENLFGNMDERYFRLIDRSEGVEELLHPELFSKFNVEKNFSDFQLIFNNPNTKSYINKMTHFDMKTLLPALLQVEDRVSMAFSLESRVPLLDYRIINLVSSIPPSIKFQGGESKYIFKKSIKNMIPKDILNRKDKMGFPVPLNNWIKKKGIVLDFIYDILLSEKSLNRGIFNSKTLELMISENGVGSRKLWGALSLELWHQRFIDG